MSRVAVVSDMHGNLTAFEAVLEDARARGAEQIWCGGDLVGKGPRGRAVVERARDACDVVVRGNWDEVVALPGSAAWEAPDWYREELGDEALLWLGRLPFHHDATIGGRRVRLFHASADSVHHRVRSGMDDAAFDAMFQASDALGDVHAADLVIYADLHQQFTDERRGMLLANTGSAGNDLAGDPSAAYLWLEGSDTGARVELLRVDYDVEAEIELARALRILFLQHWITELRTGVYQRRA